MTFAEQLAQRLDARPSADGAEVVGWRFDISEGLSLRAGLKDSKLGGPYEPPGASEGTGGGIYSGRSSYSITNSQIDKNHSFYGGGIHVNGGSPTITDNLFEQNEVVKAPINGEGGGLGVASVQLHACNGTGGAAACQDPGPGPRTNGLGPVRPHCD